MFDPYGVVVDPICFSTIRPLGDGIKEFDSYGVGI
jgi:hypothetical protein